jgi:hypothetical protein
MARRVDVLRDIAANVAAEGRTMFYVRIPGNIQPIERGDRFEEPLHEALSAANVGEVTGGGSQLGEGTTVEYCGVDVAVSDRERGLSVIRETMRALAAPAGTIIEEFLPEWQEHDL